MKENRKSTSASVNNSLQNISKSYNEEDDIIDQVNPRARYFPRLEESVDGGPQNPELLISFEHHVAFSIWNARHMREDRGRLKCHQRLSYITAWIPKYSRWWHFVEQSGLEHLRLCMHEHLDFPLLSAFVERWQPETNSFHMPWGEMTKTLHDVWKILQLKIDGNPVVMDKSIKRQEEIKELAEALCVDYLKLRDEMKKGSITYKTLRETGQVLRDEETTATAYLTYLLSTTVFIDKSQCRAQDRFFRLLRDVRQVSKYAWGVAVLASLYRSLGEASRDECRQLSGCGTLLQSWIYEYFPLLCSRRDPRYRSFQPRAMRWITSATPDQSNKALFEYRIALDRMTKEQVEWMPYGPLDFETTHLRVSRYHGPISCLKISEPYMPDRVARQFERVQHIPGPVILPDKAHRHCDPSRYNLKYPNAEWAWARRHTTHTISLEQMGKRVVAPYDCVPDYMSWYYPRTHPFLCHPQHISMRDYPRPGPGGDYIASERINRVAPLLRKMVEPMREDVPHDYWQQVLRALEHLTRYPQFLDEPECSTFEAGKSSNTIDDDDEEDDPTWNEDEDDDNESKDEDGDDESEDASQDDESEDASRDDECNDNEGEDENVEDAGEYGDDNGDDEREVVDKNVAVNSENQHGHGGCGSGNDIMDEE